MTRSVPAMLVAVVLLVVLVCTGVGAAAFPTDWAHSDLITIQENSGSDLADYQILVELNTSNFDFSKAQSYGADVRFVELDGDLLSHWIEEWDSAGENAEVWVKVPSVPTSGVTMIRMWYGNVGAADVCDGEAVFEFFDDFEDGAYMDKWTVISGTWSEHDGIIEQTTATQNGWEIQAKMADISDAVMEANVMRT